ncbi:MAG: TetR/AcrR family transcriptional regulator [Lachnospiraceae bacterium]
MMPPKAKFTREEIIEAALKIAKERGLDAVTARELGAELGSSARPIFTVFQNMDEVHEEVIKAAKEIYGGYVRKGLEQEVAFRGVGMAYVQFAIREKRLFQLLFMRENTEENDMEHILAFIDDNYETILSSVEESYDLARKDAERLYRHLWIYTHGVATLCATKTCNFTEQETEEMLTDVFSGLLKKIKEGKPE